MTPERAFDLLGLTPWADAAEVNAAWRAQRSAAHPDHGGDAAAFAELKQAYVVALAAAEAPRPCPTCHGSGRRRVASGFAAVELPCIACGGTGEEPR